MENVNTKTAPVVKEVTYNAPVSKVWNALTDKKEMKEWYFDLEEFKPEAGFEFSFYAGDEAKKFLHECKITDVVPGKRIAYTWRYPGYEGMSLVRFELFPEGNKTKLVLTHEGLETFPQNPDFKKENFINGWDDILNRSLKNYLEKNTAEK